MAASATWEVLLSRLNPLSEVTEPMHRLEKSMTAMKDEMAPIQTLPDVLKSLQRVEALLERLVMLQEAEAGVSVPVKAAPRKRAATG